METDIHRLNSNMFDPIPLPLDQDQQAPPQYQYDREQSQYAFQQPPLQQPQQPEKTDFFADIDKKTWIFILIALILGFFMGKTMQIQPIMMRSV